jgi:hypothetical protein
LKVEYVYASWWAMGVRLGTRVSESECMAWQMFVKFNEIVRNSKKEKSFLYEIIFG